MYIESDKNNVIQFFQTHYFSHCNRKTKVKAEFENLKTLDLQTWINWMSPGFPNEGKIVVEPNEKYVFYIDEKMMSKGADIMLCTSSYGCLKKMHIDCGSDMELKVKWTFGHTNQKEGK